MVSKNHCRQQCPFPRPLLPLLLLLLFLAGCGNDALDDVTKKPNSFAGGSNNPGDFRDQGTGLGAGGSLATNELRVRLQLPSPGPGADHRGLVDAEDFSLRVLRVGPGLTPLETLNPATERDGSSVILRFAEGSLPPMDIDLIVEAWADGQRYRAPLATDNRLVRVNPFSEYLVQRGLASLKGHEIRALNSCRQSLCPLELIWPSLATQVQAFNIALADSHDPQSALEALARRADFSAFVARAMDWLRLGPDAIGSLDQAVDSQNFRFNSQFFAMDLNQRHGQAGDGGLWVSRNSVRASATNDAGTGFSYPTLTLASFRLDLLDLHITTLGSVIPFRSRSLDQDLQAPRTLPDNEHATVPRNVFSRHQRFISGGRPVFQTVRRDSGAPLGRALDPYLLDGRLIGSEATPEAVLSGHFHSGQAVALRDNSRGGLERDQLQETLNSAVLQIHLRQTPEGDFSLSRMGTHYNLLGFRVRLGVGETPLQVESQLGEWSGLSGGDPLVAGRQRSDNVRRLQRHADGSVSSDTGPEGGLERSIDIQRLAHIRDDSGTGSEDFRGQLFLRNSARNHGEAVPDGPNGAASPDGNWLAFTPVSNDGSHALWLAVTPPEGLDSLHGRYQLQGFSMAISEQSNQLQSLQGACLELGDPGGPAQLNSRGLVVHHEIPDRRVFPPAQLPESILSGSIEGPDARGRLRIQLQGEDPEQSMTLEGFAAPGGEALILRLEARDRLGPVLALRDPDCRAPR